MDQSYIIYVIKKCYGMMLKRSITIDPIITNHSSKTQRSMSTASVSREPHVRRILHAIMIIVQITC